MGQIVKESHSFLEYGQNHVTLCVKKKFTKKSLKLLDSWEVKKFHGDSVKNESARAKKTRGGEAPNAPPQPDLGLTVTAVYFVCLIMNSNTMNLSLDVKTI